MQDVTLWDHALAFFLVLVLPLLTALQHKSSKAAARDLTTSDKVAAYWSNGVTLAVLAGITLIVWRVGDHPFTALGLTSVPHNVGAGLGIAAIFLALWIVDTRIRLSPAHLHETRRRWRSDTPFMPVTPREVRHSLAMVVSASVCEEIMFRGFLVNYAMSFTGPTTLGMAAAVALPGFVFAVLHLYLGWRAVVKIALLASFFGAILVVTGSLWIPIALHFVVDLVASFFLGPRLLRQE